VLGIRVIVERPLVALIVVVAAAALVGDALGRGGDGDRLWGRAGGPASAGGAAADVAGSGAEPVIVARGKRSGFVSRGSDAGAAGQRLGLNRIGRFREPIHLAQPPGAPGLLFVVQKAGLIRTVRDGRTLRRPFLDLRRRVNNRGTEQGLLSLAFAPDYRSSRRFYVAFTDRRDDLEIFEFRRSLNSSVIALRRTARRVLRIPQHFDTHNGGYLLFGPGGHLFIGAGDGGGVGDPRDNAQNKGTLRGKILRINPRRRGRRAYTTPGSNPFKGRRGRNEIFALGLRNPWRFSIDRGRLFIGDVGQDTYEEVDVIGLERANGANFGWAAWEADHRYKRSVRVRNPVFPAITYRHFPRCSVTGGHVVRDPALPSLAGRYLYGDYCTGELFTFRPRRPAATSRILPLRVPLLSSFAEDQAGHLYALSQTGPVYRLIER
jgi:hypothetical protein